MPAIGIPDWYTGRHERRVRQAASPATRKRFLLLSACAECAEGSGEWGDTLPATESMLATHLKHHAETHAASTLIWWLASIAKAHRAAGYTDPTKGELVRSVLCCIRRTQNSNPVKPGLR